MLQWTLMIVSRRIPVSGPALWSFFVHSCVAISSVHVLWAPTGTGGRMDPVPAVTAGWSAQLQLCLAQQRRCPDYISSTQSWLALRCLTSNIDVITTCTPRLASHKSCEICSTSPETPSRANMEPCLSVQGNTAIRSVWLVWSICHFRTVHASLDSENSHFR